MAGGSGAWGQGEEQDDDLGGWTAPPRGGRPPAPPSQYSAVSASGTAGLVDGGAAPGGLAVNALLDGEELEPVGDDLRKVGPGVFGFIQDAAVGSITWVLRLLLMLVTIPFFFTISKLKFGAPRRGDQRLPSKDAIAEQARLLMEGGTLTLQAPPPKAASATTRLMSSESSESIGDVDTETELRTFLKLLKSARHLPARFRLFITHYFLQPNSNLPKAFLVLAALSILYHRSSLSEPSDADVRALNEQFFNTPNGGGMVYCETANEMCTDPSAAILALREMNSFLQQILSASPTIPLVVAAATVDVGQKVVSFLQLWHYYASEGFGMIATGVYALTYEPLQRRIGLPDLDIVATSLALGIVSLALDPRQASNGNADLNQALGGGFVPQIGTLGNEVDTFWHNISQNPMGPLFPLALTYLIGYRGPKYLAERLGKDVWKHLQEVIPGIKNAWHKYRGYDELGASASEGGYQEFGMDDGPGFDIDDFSGAVAALTQQHGSDFWAQQHQQRRTVALLAELHRRHPGEVTVTARAGSGHQSS